MRMIRQELDDVIHRLQRRNATVPIPAIRIRHCGIADEDHLEVSRVYAHVGCAPNTICVSEYMEKDLEVGNIRGILVHEIGHLLHKRYKKHLKLPPTTDHEVMADSTIWTLFKVNIWYDRNKIQWVEL